MFPGRPAGQEGGPPDRGIRPAAADSEPILECSESAFLTGLMTERSTLLHDDRQGREALKGQWGDWLSTAWDWDWWVTLTYDPRKLAPGSATHTAVGWDRSDRDWRTWLESVAGEAARDDGLQSPYWFRGREPNPYRYGTHFHALVGGVASVSRRDAWERWFSAHGHARIEPYDPQRGAGFYVAKYVAKELGDLTFSPNAGLYMKEWNDGSRNSARDLAPDGWARVDR